MAKIDFLTGFLTGQRIMAQMVRESVPEAAMYLYGTPNEGGNIGLRNGESVTYYNGVVAKPVSELYDENYPIVCVTMGGVLSGIEVMMFSNVTPYPNGRLEYDKRVDFKYDEATHEWVYDTSLTDGTVFTSGIVWTNTTLYDTDGNVTHNVSDPIPVYTGMVGYTYNGTVLPKLPECNENAYPYAILMTKHTRNGALTEAYVWFLDKPVLHEPSTGKVTTNKTNKYISFRYYVSGAENGWQPYGSGGGRNWIDTTRANSILRWSNHGVYTPSGTLYLAESDPIPVYE